MTAPQSGNVAEIQALRAIAVSLVVLYHGKVSFLPGGYVGVDVFFVISGYLITALLLREYARKGSIDFQRFYARRIRRLLPAAVVMALVTTAFFWFLYSPLQFKEVTASAMASSLYLSNAWFYHLSTDYLAGDTHNNPFLHTWSLSVEEQFYLLWPMVIVAISKKSANGVNIRRALIGLGALSLCSFILCVLQTETDQPLAFFGPHTRAWEFGVGGILALLHSRPAELESRSRNFFLFSGLLLIFAPAFLFNETTSFPGHVAIFPVIGTASVIHSSRGAASNLSQWMKSKPVQFIGDISYSFYLWHWPTSLALNALEISSHPTWTLLYISISLILATASYYLVENPVRYSQSLGLKPIRSFAFGISTSCAAIGLIYLARVDSVHELNSESQAVLLEAVSDNSKTYSDGCHYRQSATEIREDCIYGTAGGAQSIVIFGDSHAANWFPALESISLRKGYKLINLTKSACPSIVLEPFNSMFKRTYTECTIWRKNAFNLLAELRPHLVVLANSSSYATEEEGSKEKLDEMKLSIAVSETVTALDNLGLRFVFVKDIPRVEYEPLHCLSRALWKSLDPSSTCTLKPQTEARERVWSITKEVVDGSSLGSTINLNDAICPAHDRCTLARDGIVLYRDSHHLTASFSRALGSTMSKMLEDADLLVQY
ncbi:acyltransferase family protein [Seongchinamella sediminis]|nr:acyltransferase family protein [Seongchinamella sediminis]